jgi:hypothetical protein
MLEIMAYFVSKSNCMKKHYFILSICFIAVLSILTGCDKGDDPGPAPKTKTEHITAATWKFDNAKAGGSDISSNPMLTCYKDNTMTFSSNLTGTISEGATVCASPAPPTFTWSFQTSETILNISAIIFPGGSSNFTVNSVNETNLVLSQDVTIPPAPMPVNVVITFKH